MLISFPFSQIKTDIIAPIEEISLAISAIDNLIDSLESHPGPIRFIVSSTLNIFGTFCNLSLLKVIDKIPILLKEVHLLGFRRSFRFEVILGGIQYYYCVNRVKGFLSA